MRSSDTTETETGAKAEVGAQAGAGSGSASLTQTSARGQSVGEADIGVEAAAEAALVPSLPLLAAPTQPARDLGSMIGFTPRVPYGCLGWHLAIQPGPAPHAPVDRLPPRLWSTSALCPVLVLPASSAEAAGRGSAIRLPPAIRMPRLPAWEHAVALIVRRNQQARRHRRDYPHPPGAPSHTTSLSAALRLAQALEDRARTVRGKDPMRRETRSLERESSSLAALRPAAAAASADGGPRTAPRAENPVRRERSAASRPDPKAPDLLSAGRVTSALAATNAVCLKDPMRRGCSAASAPGSEASDRLSAARPASTLAVTAAPARVEHPLRRENDAPASSLFAASAGMSGNGAPPHPITAGATASGARDPMRRENSRTGPLRNGNPRGNPNLAPRCGARTRQGCPCKGPAMRNGRCRMHGGKSTGPRTAEGLARLRAARIRHGGYSAEARAFERSCRSLIRDTRLLLAWAERPAESRPTLAPEALFDALPPVPQAVPPSGPPLPPSEQTGGKSPYAVRTALPDPPFGPGNQATAALGFGPSAAFHPPHAMRKDPMRRERQPLLGPSAVRIALPSLAPAAGPSAGARAAREHSHRP